jgi:hypothetical protein
VKIAREAIRELLALKDNRQKRSFALIDQRRLCQ